MFSGRLLIINSTNKESATNILPIVKYHTFKFLINIHGNMHAVKRT
jgi:hypothetical protein